MAHDQPTYASVPGIRVFGMMCVKPSGETNNGYHIQRPVPPKRNQYIQSQSSYYNRFKKHTLSKPLPAQQKTNENNSNIATQSSESADFTTRGISIVPAEAETREDVSNESLEVDEEVPSSTFDASSSSYSTTFSSTDSVSTEPATDATSRKKRSAFEDATDSNAPNNESSSRNKRDDWPDIPWEEISQQIKDIQWD